jgi:RNA polymerase sigma factor (sigma-70 family)
VSNLDRETQVLLRTLAPEVLGRMLRRYRDLPEVEDAVQEALIAAATQWPRDGKPANPTGWLLRVAGRRLTDQVRADAARRHREALVVSLIPMEEQVALSADEAYSERDDTLDLVFTCCHPSLSTASAIALTLRAVGGLTTREIAAAFLVPEATMAQRISRAKQTIKDSDTPFSVPVGPVREARLVSVLHVLYLIFNEGYTASSGEELARTDLSDEAIRLTRMLRRLMPDEAEVAGLLALMLLTDARRAARTGPLGELVPLDRQDRSLWNRERIAEGVALISDALPRGETGPYQVQAAIAAVHDEATSVEATDWPQVLTLYELLLLLIDTPMARLSHAIALAMVHGASAGLARLAELESDARLRDSHRLMAARAHLLERDGRVADAADAYRRAAERTASVAERDYLIMQASRLGGD